MLSMILTIDVGNTLIKCAVFENNNIVDKIIFDKTEIDKKISKIILNYPKIENAIVSSVGEGFKKSFLTLEKDIKTHFVSANDVFPFQNLYETPKTLGIDRLVLATGAVLSFPNQNRLVIDAGTCVTYDFINDKNQYLGGAISPGIRLRYESLHNYTAKLPLLTKELPEKPIGNSTSQSIHSGVINGLCQEIQGFTNLYGKDCENFIIILTGGDAIFLAKRLKNSIFVNSNFLLESLHNLYQYKQQND